MVKRFLSMTFWLMPFWAQAGQQLDVLTLDGRRITLSVELADTPEKQGRGLMYVTHLPPKSGMVFPMQPPRQAMFWMRNTMIPLDMIFIMPGGIIGQIVTRLDTQSDVLTRSLGKVSGVLEINAGEASKLNIGVGDTIRMNGVLF
jgi:uncharacterized membrane protein (UPF0127 family)